jgi:hypothetical protein
MTFRLYNVGEANIHLCHCRSFGKEGFRNCASNAPPSTRHYEFSPGQLRPDLHMSIGVAGSNLFS